MKNTVENTRIYDNNGKTFDRYTIVLKDRSMFGASENPFSPLGFGQYCGELPIHRNYNFLGKKIKFADLPEDVQKYVKQLVKD